MKKTSIQTILLTIVILFSINISFSQVSFTNMASTIYETSGSGREDCVVDMNGDQLDDIVRIIGGKIRINYQQTDGSFTEKNFSLSLQNRPGWSMAAGDLNNDGFTDLLLGDQDAVSFILAINGGTDYQEQAVSEFIFAQRTTMADIDNDGALDAFVCHDTDQSRPYRNDGSGYMTADQTLIETLPLAGNYAAIWVDYDNDGDSDMYLTKCKVNAPISDPARVNAMYQNDGNGVFTEVGVSSNMDDSAQSWATVFEDFDNDGDFDAFTVNHDFTNRFMENNGNGTFTNIISTTGIDANDLGSWENATGDFNNDGFVDIFSWLEKELYLNNGDMTFTGTDLDFKDGAIGDLNNDGFLDVVKNADVFINTPNNNNWVKFNLQGIDSNHSGIGARVEIHGDWGVQIREVRSGQSFSPMSSLAIHFGIGSATAIDQVIVKWPSGLVTIIPNPAINKGHLILEATCFLEPTTVSVNGNTTICAGETVTLSVPEGFENYYWNNGMRGSAIEVSNTGSYSVVLKDVNGCASLSNKIIVEKTADVQPVVMVTGNTSFCEGGSVILSTEGGMNPTWSNGATGNSTEVNTTGNYTVAVDADCAAGNISSENVEVKVVSHPTKPEITASAVNADNSVSLSASGNNLLWFDLPIAGNVLGSGNDYTSIPLTTETTFYVEDSNSCEGAFQTGGKETATGPGGVPAQGGYNLFDVDVPFKLLTVDVLVPIDGTPGPRLIQLYDENEVVLNQMLFDLAIGGHTLTLNWDLPVGKDFSIRCEQENLFRNNEDVSFPYLIGDVGVMTGSNFGAAFYYYFYNLQIQKENTVCVSDRASITMTAVAIDEIESIHSLAVYPIPTTRNLTVEFNATTANVPLTIVLFDVVGKLALNKVVKDLTFGQNLVHLNVSELPVGIYNLVLQMNGQKTIRKVVVE